MIESEKQEKSSRATWLLDTKRKHLHGCGIVEQQLSYSVNRSCSSRRFFRNRLARHFTTQRFAGLYPHYYWFFTSHIMLVLLPMTVVKFGVKDSVRDYGCRLDNAKFGGGIYFKWLVHRTSDSSTHRKAIRRFSTEILT